MVVVKGNRKGRKGKGKGEGGRGKGEGKVGRRRGRRSGKVKEMGKEEKGRG